MLGGGRRVKRLLVEPTDWLEQSLDTALSINAQYGQNPDQGQIYSVGNTYLQQNFPGLDYIASTSIDNIEWDWNALIWLRDWLLLIWR
jgi:hypothetical protein